MQIEHSSCDILFENKPSDSAIFYNYNINGKFLGNKYILKFNLKIFFDRKNLLIYNWAFV